MKKTVVSLLAVLLTLSFAVNSSAAAAGSPESLISTALSELEYEEGAKSYSKYGQWYGIPNGHWCDMFVSWCANEAGIPSSAFPRSATCTTHMQSFRRMGCYHDSAARGGSYVPKQGDLIFFFDPVSYPNGNVLRHVGIVLCVENGDVFTIEGNTLTNRLDEPSYYEAAAKAAAALDASEIDRPDDYVAVKHYPLGTETIHGYAEIGYQDQTNYAPGGFIDLGKYEPLRAVFEALDASGIMPATSRYTYSPRYGVTRGEFLQLVTALYGLSGWDASVEEFSDVPADSVWYGAVMTARAAGIVHGSGGNAFLPDLYVSPSEAQTILSRALRYAGLEDRIFAFSEGDYSYLAPYTVRADIAQALYELLCETALPEESAFTFSVGGEPVDWRALTVFDENYVSVDALRQVFPRLKTVEEPTEDATDGAGELTEDTDSGVRLPVPMAHCDRVFLSAVTLAQGRHSAEVTAFVSSDVVYVNLRQTAAFLNMEIQCDGETGTVELSRAN